MIKNSSKLAKNQRLAFAFRALNAMDESKIDMITSDSQKFLESLEYEPHY